MNKFKLSPYVTYQFYGTLSQLYEFINKHNIVVYAIDISDNIHFKIHIMDEYKIYHNKKCSRVTYDGLIGLFIRQILNIRRLIGIIVFIYVIYILRNVCFDL